MLRVGAIVAIFAILALSLTLIAGTAGQVSLGQAGLFAIGAYTSALLTKEHGWSFWLALPASGAVAAVLGVVILSPALRLRGHYVAIVTLGIGAMIGSALLNFEAVTHGPMGVPNIPPPSLFGYQIVSSRDYYLLSLAVLLRLRRPGRRAAALASRARLARHPGGRDRRPVVRRAAGRLQVARVRRSAASSPGWAARCSPTSTRSSRRTCSPSSSRSRS